MHLSNYFEDAGIGSPDGTECGIKGLLFHLADGKQCMEV